MLKYLLTILLFCTSISFSFSQEIIVDPSKKVEVVEAYDEMVDDEEAEELFIDTIITIRPVKISEDSIRLWKQQPDFKYLSNLDSLLDVEQQKKENAQQQTGSGPRVNVGSPDTSFLSGLMWLLAIAFVVFVVYQLLQNKGLFKGGSSRLKVAEVANEAEEDILEMNIQQMLTGAEQQSNYRLATRYHFIKTLQLLNEKSKIDFSADKTNRQYLYEIPEQWRSEFSRLVLNYEYIWFGNVQIDQTLYNKITTLHNSFNNRI